jgi:hypothetical protein
MSACGERDPAQRFQIVPYGSHSYGFAIVFATASRAARGSFSLLSGFVAISCRRKTLPDAEGVIDSKNKLTKITFTINLYFFYLKIEKG